MFILEGRLNFKLNCITSTCNFKFNLNDISCGNSSNSNLSSDIVVVVAAASGVLVEVVVIVLVVVGLKVVVV